MVLSGWPPMPTTINRPAQLKAAPKKYRNQFCADRHRPHVLSRLLNKVASKVGVGANQPWQFMLSADVKGEKLGHAP